MQTYEVCIKRWFFETARLVWHKLKETSLFIPRKLPYLQSYKNTSYIYITNVHAMSDIFGVPLKTFNCIFYNVEWYWQLQLYILKYLHVSCGKVLYVSTYTTYIVPIRPGRLYQYKLRYKGNSLQVMLTQNFTFSQI